jgi:hypothetical protein
MMKTIIFGLLAACATASSAQTLNADETARLRSFLEQESAQAGKKNHEQLGITQLENVDWKTVPGLVTTNVNLREFCCRYNRLTDLDISHNTKLIHFCGTGNMFEQIDISHNTELADFYCANNRLERIDLSHNRKLVNVALRTNRLTTLDCSAHPRLATLTCYDNRLESLDVSGCPALVSLDCKNNQLTTLDVPDSPELALFACQGNRLTFSTLPLPGYRSYTYSPQAEIGVSFPADVVDLSGEYLAAGQTSEYAWTDGVGADVTPLSGEAGVFSFDRLYTGKTLVCRIRNAAFPDLTMTYRIALTTPVHASSVGQDVSVYAVRGGICLRADRPVPFAIYNMAGMQVCRRATAAGEVSLALPRGVYVVTMEGRGWKVAVE